ncbi:MAG: glycosyl transferase family 2 [Geobacteraceae bacterium GWC2_53_11]|nr:MAG: glycosyl transferase family 2 [Geobacteraceae bacterium GWC2_53_11]
MTSLSIVIPVFNAENTISDLCRTLMKQLSTDYGLEIVLINDFSRDGSDAVCKELQAEFPETITYARLSRNFGEHNAVMAGLNQAQGDYVVIMDDDFQNPPEEVPKLLAELSKGYDVVYSQYPEKNDNIFRNLGSYLNGSMARVILHKPANLYLSSFKAMNRFLVNELISYKSPTPYLDAIILRITRNIGTVEVRHDKRVSGRSGYNLKKLTALWGDMIVSYSLIPLRLLAMLGIILTLLGVYSVGDMIIKNLLPTLSDPSELEELTSVSLFFRGFQLFATGILGEYVGRIYLRLNQEPQYIIREMLSAVSGHDTSGKDRHDT